MKRKRTNLPATARRINHARGQEPLVIYGKKGEGIHKMEIHGKRFLIGKPQERQQTDEPSDIDFIEI